MKAVLFFLITCLPLSAEVVDRGVVRIQGFQKDRVVNACLGFIVEQEGFVLTNYLNLTQPGTGQLLDRFEVTAGAECLDAEIIGVEPTINIAILKISREEPFTPVVCALKREVTPGMPLQAFSFQDGQMPAIDGVVSALNTKLCYQHSLVSTMFRARLPLSDAFVGGPVFFPDSGEVAAIYTGFKPVPEPGHAEEPGEAHLLPISLCFNIYESLKTKRSLKSPWTGFSVRPLTAAEQGFFPTARKHHGGVAIEEVWEGGPAQKLGIQTGDILVQFSYNRIQSVADFQKWLYMYGVGHPVKLILLRHGTEYLMTDYLIEERPGWARPR